MRFVLALVLLVSVAPSIARAQTVPPQPETRLFYNNLTAARVNPLGLADYARFTFQYRLFEDDSPILTQNFIGAGVSMGLSPAWGRIGPIVEIQPLTILRLYAQYNFVGYFSSFNLFASFPSASSDYSDTAIREAPDMGRANYATIGGELTLGANLQFKLGPVAMRNFFRAVYSNYDMERDDRVFYDQIIDIAVPNDGWYVSNDLDLFALIAFDEDIQLAMGARYTYTHAFYDDSHFQPGEDRDLAPDNDIHRLGPIFALRLDSNPGGMIDNPSIILLAQWHLVHRFRTGADVNIGLPLIVVAFTFRGDLLSDH